MGHFLGTEAYVPPPVRKILEVGAIILLPVALGMWVRSASEARADHIERWIKPLSLLILMALIVFSVIKEWQLIERYALTVGGVCLTLNLASLGFGYGVARMMRLERQQAIAIAFEIGIHNSTIAIFIALNVLGDAAFSVPAALYSLVMYFSAGTLIFLIRRGGR